MPYINDEDAKKIGIEYYKLPMTPGELNYTLSKIAADYLLYHYGTNPSYAERSEVHSQLQCATNEFQRRILDPYEDKKMAIEENADPYAIFE
jgi:hypothetical protein